MAAASSIVPFTLELPGGIGHAKLAVHIDGRPSEQRACPPGVSLGWLLAPLGAIVRLDLQIGERAIRCSFTAVATPCRIVQDDLVVQTAGDLFRAAGAAG